MNLGGCELGKKPRIVAVVDTMMPVAELLSVKNFADILEMRVDCYNDSTEAVTRYLDSVRTGVGLPMIGTVRENEITKHKRVELFESIMPYVDAIDVELGTPISADVIACVNRQLVIVSEHDFERMPDAAGLQSMVDRSVKQGAHIVKIAAMAHNREEVVRMLEFTRTCKVPLVTIAMGDHGSVSRVIAPLFGSLFSYGFITNPVAPGQLSTVKLFEAFREYYPG